MSIFKTEVPEGIVNSTDQVVSAACGPYDVNLPGCKKTSEMNVHNTQRGAVRRKSGD